MPCYCILISIEKTLESRMDIKKQNNKTSPLKSTAELSALMDKVLEKAKKQGATDAAVSVNHDNGFSVDVRMGEIETIAFSEDNGVTLTVYFGHRKGSASSTDTSEDSLDTIIHAACEIAKVSAEDPCFGLADAALMGSNYPDLDLYHPWDLNPEKAIEMAVACEKQALSLDTRIANSDGVSVSTSTSHHGYANTAGGRGLIHTSRHGMSCSLIAKLGEAMQRDYDYTTARLASDLVDITHLAQNAVGRVVSRLGAKQIKTQKTPVIFSSRISSGLFSSFISAISGTNLYRKSTFLLDSLGKTIFPANIQIYEQPHLLRGLGSSPIDGDGVLTRNNHFIKDGQLMQYVLGTYTARRLGLETTANSDGVHNLTIDATSGDLKTLLQTMGTGLLVTELMGQGVNIISGDYSRGASGFWVEKGEIQYPVEGITIAGNLKNIFMDILAVGNDINPNISARCGSVLIREMMVAGSNE
jgi:PmbA protein